MQELYHSLGKGSRQFRKENYEKWILTGALPVGQPQHWGFLKCPIQCSFLQRHFVRDGWVQWCWCGWNMEYVNLDIHSWLHIPNISMKIELYIGPRVLAKGGGKCPLILAWLDNPQHHWSPDLQHQISATILDTTDHQILNTRYQQLIPITTSFLCPPVKVTRSTKKEMSKLCNSSPKMSKKSKLCNLSPKMSKTIKTLQLES